MSCDCCYPKPDNKDALKIVAMAILAIFVIIGGTGWFANYMSKTSAPVCTSSG